MQRPPRNSQCHLQSRPGCLPVHWKKSESISFIYKHTHIYTTHHNQLIRYPLVPPWEPHLNGIEEATKPLLLSIWWRLTGWKKLRTLQGNGQKKTLPETHISQNLRLLLSRWFSISLLMGYLFRENWRESSQLCTGGFPSAPMTDTKNSWTSSISPSFSTESILARDEDFALNRSREWAEHCSQALHRKCHIQKNFLTHFSRK